MATKKQAASARKRATKTATESPKPPKRVPAHGNGALFVGGVPGNKGGTGRPPNWLREWCDALLADPLAKKQVEEILKDKDHSAFSSMWKAVADRAHGKPKELVEHSGTVTLEALIVESLPK